MRSDRAWRKHWDCNERNEPQANSHKPQGKSGHRAQVALGRCLVASGWWLVANKVDTVADNITTALQALVTAGTLKAVRRQVILPFGEINPPVVGLVIADLARQTLDWTATVTIMLVANKGGVSCDERVTELVAVIDGAISALATGGSAGGSIDCPRWDFWYAAQNAGQPLQHVGALASLRVRVEDPILIVEEEE